MVAPDSLGEHSLIYGMSGTHEEIFQDVELLLQQRYRLSVDLQYLGNIIQDDISDLIAHIPVVAAPACDASDTGHKLRHMERLCKIIIGSKLESLHFIVKRVTC